MKTKLTPYSAFDDLIKDERTAHELLAEALVEDEPAVFIALLGQYARTKGIAEIAVKTGLSRESLYKSLSGERYPRWDTVCKVLKALEIELRVV